MKWYHCADLGHGNFAVHYGDSRRISWLHRETSWEEICAFLHSIDTDREFFKSTGTSIAHARFMATDRVRK